MSIPLGVFVAVFFTVSAYAQGLQIHFGERGLETLSYKGQLLQDVSKWRADELQLGHMLCLDGHGKPLTDGGFVWGETNKGRTWDVASHTWTYRFGWGTIRVGYQQRGDSLELHMTETNNSDSGITLDGASAFPLTLHLPSSAFASTEIADDVEVPGVTTATWGSSRLSIVVPDERRILYSGYQRAADGALRVIVSSTRPDALPHAGPSVGRRVKPGETDSFVVALRFGEKAQPLEEIAPDALKSFVERWPQTLQWSDRRPIGTVFLASSPQGDKKLAGGFPKNPRRYFTDGETDVRDGLEAFQTRVLQQAETVVANLRRMNAQGAITWDIEGEEYPQDTSYVCAPDEIAHTAPEMESIVTMQQYAGMKLVDAYFRIIREAGFRVGVCVRPQHFEININGIARQRSLPDGEVAAELIRKMRFAHDRWGATIFYLDSTVRADGSTLPSSIIEEAASAMPDSLLIPEESTFRMYRATAPFQTFLFHGDLGTAGLVRASYTHGFSANMLNDVDMQKLVANKPTLTQAVHDGDILMGLAGFWHANDATILGIYRAAGKP